jgi:hypothetical protein
MDYGPSKKNPCEEMKHVILALLILATVHHKEVKKEPKYRTIFDFDPNKQELIEMCCPRKPNPLSPFEHLPHPQTF